MPLTAEELDNLSRQIPGFETSPKLRYLADKKLLPQQREMESFENPSTLTTLRRATYGHTKAEKQLIKRQEEALVPFEQEQAILGKLQAMQKFQESIAPPIGVARREYGIVPAESQLRPAPDVPMYGPGAPQATGIQPGQGFTPQELAQPISTGAMPLQAFQQQYEQRARPYFEEGPRPMARQLDEQAPLLPYQVNQLQPLLEAKAVMQGGQFQPTPLARPQGNLLSGEEANRQAEELRAVAQAQGVNMDELPKRLSFAPTAQVNRAAFEAHQNQITELLKKRVESRQNEVLNTRATNLSAAQTELLALPEKSRTFDAAGRIAKKYASSGVTPHDVMQAVKNPNAPLVNVDMSTKTAEVEFTKSTRETYDKLKHAPTLLDNIDEAKKLIGKAKGFMGPGGETLLEAAKFLNNRLGTSIHTEGVKSAEELRTRIFFNIMDNLKKLDAQPSQMQQLIMMESLGKLGTDPNAMYALLDAFGDQIRAKIRLHNAEIDSAEQAGTKFPYNPRISLKKNDVDAKLDALLNELKKSTK